jgi:putative aminopeptidase FrvX
MSPIDTTWMTEFLVGLLETPSPAGDTARAIEYVRDTLTQLAIPVEINRKGALIATLAGQAEDRPRALTAHVDTLGAMVQEIKKDGRLKLTQIGGYAWNSVEGEGCTVLTSEGRHWSGTVLPVKASVHVHGKEVRELEREGKNMEVRLDARTTSSEETRALGIEVGDFVVFDPRVKVTETGFIRSRHLDDKAGVAVIVGAITALVENGRGPAQRTTILISNFEEVGHGAATGIPADVAELLVVDMAAVGEGQQSDEFSVGICAKDSGGPYDLDLRRRLVSLCEAAGIPYHLDIYPYYGSDGAAAWRAGADLVIGLMGPGVDASHGYERTHQESLSASAHLIHQYLQSQ